MAWPSKAERPRALGAWAGSLRLLALALLALMAASGATLAAPANAADRAGLDGTVRYLQDVQNADGGFARNTGEASSPEFTAWAALALAAAGINPQSQSRSTGEPSTYTYMLEHAAKQTLTTEFELELLVVDAAGTSPQDFGGVNLLREILARQLPAGGFSYEAADHPEMDATIFAIIALSPIHEPAVEEAIRKALTWLEGQQNCDGSWPSAPREPATSCPAAGREPEGETDLTAAAIEALNAAGVHRSTAQTKALDFLHAIQIINGGFPEFPRQTEANTASTSWAVQAIWAAGENPETWKQGTGEEPLDYLASMQREDGSIQYEASSDESPIWMTAYAGPAYAGLPYPIPAVPPEAPPNGTPAGTGTGNPSPPAAGEPGENGQSSQTGGGVTAGGGGYGAALFSRPQPQSKGSTPGGVRQLAATRRRRAGHGAAGPRAGERRRDPGRLRQAPVPTTTATSVASPEPGAGSSTSTGTAPAGDGRGAASAGAGSGGGARAGGVPLPGAGRGGRAGGSEVTGVLIGAATGVDDRDQQEPGAPGLHSAGAGGSPTSALATGIGGAALALALAGSLLERRRPRVVL